ncbi:MAG: putative signal transduction protein with domain [Cyanobacteria bacterium RYN_339]|nr:putative signal transduction protein with domain [Cyanobacteria bacterium RYN_339]
MKVLLATDGSACARAALAFAARVLPLAELEVVVASVAALPSPFLCGAPTALGPMPDMYYGQLVELAERQAHEAVLGARELLGPAGRQARLIEREGDPAARLLEVAAAEAPDLIVVGSHGRGLLGRTFLGSVSETLLHRWQGPIMVIREAGACQPQGAAPGPATLGRVMTGALLTATEDVPLRVAARMMAEADVGALPVLRDGRLVGIITDRDIVVRAVARDADPGTATVGSFCTREPAVGTPAMAVTEAVHLMNRHKVRRLPVLDAGRLVGIVSLGDLAEVAPHRAEAVLVEISKSPRTLAHGT